MTGSTSSVTFKTAKKTTKKTAKKTNKKKPTCVKGYNCGLSCIAKNRNCRVALDGEPKNYAQWLQAKQPKQETAEKKAPTGSPIPSFKSLVKVKDLGGSTGAVLMEDPATGKQYVVKRGASADHLRSEALADTLYESLGLKVPRHNLQVDDDGSPVKVAEFIKGRTLAEFTKTASPDEVDAVKKKLQEGFAVDAILANWDVIGLSQDNILVDDDGQPYRVDNGGALLFRAQGAKKSNFDTYPTELWTMRDSKLSPQAASVFETRNEDGTRTGFDSIAKNILSLKDQDIEAALSKVDDPKLRDTLRGRFREAKRAAELYTDVRADFNEAYSDDFAKHSMGMRKAGVFANQTKLLPTTARDGANGLLVDADGKSFDNLRGEDSVTERGLNYIDSLNLPSGYDSDLVLDLYSGQKGSSGSLPSRRYKRFLVDQMGTDPLSYYWPGDSIPPAPKSPGYREVMIASHALTYETLRGSGLNSVDPGKRTIGLARTETDEVLEMYGFNVSYETRQEAKVLQERRMTRGANESFSAITPPEIYGDQMTTQVLPLHRATMTWLLGPGIKGKSTYLYNDRENEIVAIPDGAQVRYWGKLPPARFRVEKDGSLTRDP